MYTSVRMFDTGKHPKKIAYTIENMMANCYTMAFSESVRKLILIFYTDMVRCLCLVFFLSIPTPLLHVTCPNICYWFIEFLFLAWLAEMIYFIKHERKDAKLAMFVCLWKYLPTESSLIYQIFRNTIHVTINNFITIISGIHSYAVVCDSSQSDRSCFFVVWP